MKKEYEKEKIDYELFVNDSDHYSHIETRLSHRIHFEYAVDTLIYSTNESLEKAKNGDLRELFVLLHYFNDDDVEELCGELPNELAIELRKAKKSLDSIYDDEPPIPREHYHCRECSIDTYDLQMFQLKDEVWLTIAKKDERLCFPCAEKRLKREITPEDFRNRWWGKDVIEEIREHIVDGVQISNQEDYE